MHRSTSRATMAIRDLLRRWLGPARRPSPPADPRGRPRRTDLPPGARRGLIGLGDLVWALDTLAPADQETAARISRCLGFTHQDPNPPQRLRGAYDQSRAPQASPAPAEPLPPPAGAPPFGAPPMPPDLPDLPLDTEWSRLDPVPAPARPDWLDRGPPLDLARPPPVRRAPLLPRRTATGVLAAAVATRRTGDAPDLPRTIALLARGERVRALPRLPVAGLGHGITLLLDLGESMTPFRGDLGDLTRALGRVVGRSRCRVLEFTGDPATAAGWGPAGGAAPWRPEPGQPVVLATDFGLGGPPGARDRAAGSTWRRFARQVRAARCPRVAFVPLPPTRWPVRLARHITLIHWDPRPTAGAVRRLVGPGHAVPE